MNEHQKNRLEIPISEQESTDFDWFGVDQDGCIAHFTTAGFKLLPATVIKDWPGLKTLTTYFEHQASVTGTHILDAELPNLVSDWKGEDKEQQYLRSFVAMAHKGLFSFDIQAHIKPGLGYFRVAIPTSPLSISELPVDIQDILGRTKLDGVQLRNTRRILHANTLAF